MTADTYRRILIVKLSAIGDVLMATPVAGALRKAFPDSTITWVVERKCADVVLGNPYVDDVVVWERRKTGRSVGDVVHLVGSLFQLKKKLREREYDVCLDLQGRIRSAAVSWASGAALRVGFADGEEGSPLAYHVRYAQQSADVTAQQRNLDLLRVIGVHSTDTTMHMPVSDDDRRFARGFFEQSDLVGRRVVAFCPATTWANKHWTPEGWSMTADLIAKKHDAVPVIMGSKADVPLARTIVDAASCRAVISAGLTTLKQAGAIMELATAVIGVDTGLLHMAVALDRPTVGLFGASVWRCFLKKNNFVWVAREFECSPCMRHPTCENFDCMQAILPEEVEAAVAPFLAAGGEPVR